MKDLIYGMILLSLTLIIICMIMEIYNFHMKNKKNKKIKEKLKEKLKNKKEINNE